MHQESGGHEQAVSPVGAMGLMQVMPATYDGLRQRHHLGDDAFDPHNNILAGTAYIREMYDVFGTPGFLAAYDAGPARLDDYFHRHRQLPTETRRYVARVGSEISGIYPAARSDADLNALNSLPINTPDPGPSHRVLVAQALRRERARAASRYAYAARRTPTVRESGQRAAEEEVAMLPETGRGHRHPAPAVRVAAFTVTHRDWPHLFTTASAADRMPHNLGVHGRFYPARAVCHHVRGKVCARA